MSDEESRAWDAELKGVQDRARRRRQRMSESAKHGPPGDPPDGEESKDGGKYIAAISPVKNNGS